MPRKDFLKDLQKASDPAKVPNTYPQIENIRPGEDDGAIAFTYVPEDTHNQPIDIEAFVSGKF